MKFLEFVCVLMGDLKLIFLDEFVVGVNFVFIEVLIDKIEEFNCVGKIFLIIEYDMDFVMCYCDLVIVFVEGCVVFEGLVVDVQFNFVLLDVYLGVLVDV